MNKFKRGDFIKPFSNSENPVVMEENGKFFSIDAFGKVYKHTLHNFDEAEIFNGELTGKQKILKIISSYLNEKISLEVLINACHDIRSCKEQEELLPYEPIICNALSKFFDFVPGNLYTIIGRPAMGKTTVAINLLNELEFSGKKLLYIFTDPYEYYYFTKENTRRNYDIFYTPKAMIDEIQEIIFKENYDIVFLDYFQCMYEYKDDDIAFELKKIAEETDTAMIILSQAQRAIEARKDSHICLTDVKDKLYGTLSEYSDVIIGLYRNAYYCIGDDNDIEFNILKNNGKTGTAKVDFEMLLKRRMLENEPL